jgi:hypothetical protein
VFTGYFIFIIIDFMQNFIYISLFYLFEVQMNKMMVEHERKQHEAISGGGLLEQITKLEAVK